MLFTKDEYKKRLKKVQIAMQDKGIELLISHDTAIKTRNFIGNDIAAWASYQPAFDMIVKKEPDLLD